MKTSEKINELVKALCAAQSQMKAAKKSEDNSFFKSKYADLANVIENDRIILTTNGLSIVQGAELGPDGMTVFVTTRLMHTSEQWIEDTLGARPKDTLPQSVGATVTYLRRYGYMAMVGATAEGEDDDGESTASHEKPINPNYVKVRTEGTLPNKTNEKNPIEESMEDLRKRFAALKNSGMFSQAEMKAFNIEIEKINDSRPSIEFLVDKWELDLVDRRAVQKKRLNDIFEVTEGKNDAGPMNDRR